jgi:hypothetical protein
MAKWSNLGAGRRLTATVPTIVNACRVVNPADRLCAMRIVHISADGKLETRGFDTVAAKGRKDWIFGLWFQGFKLLPGESLQVMGSRSYDVSWAGRTIAP